MVDSRSLRLKEVAALFLRLGSTAFGGPAAHVALMEDEVVKRRQWLTANEFADLVGASNLIPGPNSTELAIHIGLRRAGWAGLIVAGACFILPATCIVTLLAILYVRHGSLPSAIAVLSGIKPVILAIVLQALGRLGRTILKTRVLAMVSIAAVAALIMGLHELLVLFIAGFFIAAWRLGRKVVPRIAPGLILAPPPMPLAIAGSAVVAGPVALGLWPLFWFFVKVGSVLFGSGYVLLAFLRADLVERWGWLSEAQLLDAVTAGQITPGPVFSTATFVGGILGGVPGAVVATAGIFLPAFVFVALTAPIVSKLRSSAVTAGFLDGVNAASLALMAVVSYQLAAGTLRDVPSIGLTGAALLIFWRWRMNSTWLILAGAVVGLLRMWLGH